MDVVESLQRILAKKTLNPPDEIGVVKDFIKRKYKSGCRVKLKHNALIVSVPNSALAATIQLERQKLIAACNLGDRRLVIRTGQ